MASYKTGGQFPPKGIAKHGGGGTPCEITHSGAGKGTTAGQPNARPIPAPGGKGSAGTASSTKAK